MSVRLQMKWFWVWVPLQSHGKTNLKIVACKKSLTVNQGIAENNIAKLDEERKSKNNSQKRGLYYQKDTKDARRLLAMYQC